MGADEIFQENAKSCSTYQMRLASTVRLRRVQTGILSVNSSTTRYMIA